MIFYSLFYLNWKVDETQINEEHLSEKMLFNLTGLKLKLFILISLLRISRIHI